MGGTNMKNKKKKEKPNLESIDLMNLKNHGVTNKKISRMIGIPIEKVNRYFRNQEKLKHYSGVF